MWWEFGVWFRPLLGDFSFRFHVCIHLTHQTSDPSDLSGVRQVLTHLTSDLSDPFDSPDQLTSDWADPSDSNDPPGLLFHLIYMTCLISMTHVRQLRHPTQSHLALLIYLTHLPQVLPTYTCACHINKAFRCFQRQSGLGSCRVPDWVTCF